MLLVFSVVVVAIVVAVALVVVVVVLAGSWGPCFGASGSRVERSCFLVP